MYINKPNELLNFQSFHLVSERSMTRSKSSGGHHADVCDGDDKQTRQTSFPSGTLH